MDICNGCFLLWKTKNFTKNRRVYLLFIDFLIFEFALFLKTGFSSKFDIYIC